MRFVSTCLLAALLLLASCTEKQQRQADERAEQAKRDLQKAARKVKNDAERLGEEAKRKSQELTDSTRSAVKPDSESAQGKIDRAAGKAMNAGHAAKTEADRLALKARIKAALANDVGLKTLSNLSVDLDDSTAILTGTVPTAADKDRAYQTALSVPGVSRVVNNVRVE